MWHDLLTALALLFIIEGIFPFLNPAGMRRLLMAIQDMDDKALRIAGLVSMIIGVSLLYIVR